MTNNKINKQDFITKREVENKLNGRELTAKDYATNN